MQENTRNSTVKKTQIQIYLGHRQTRYLWGDLRCGSWVCGSLQYADFTPVIVNQLKSPWQACHEILGELNSVIMTN